MNSVNLMVFGLSFIFLAGCAAGRTVLNDDDRTGNGSELRRLSYDSRATGQERDYFVYLPDGYHANPDKEWPVMLFLHGNGERGDGKEELDFVMVHGPLYEAWVQKRELPFVIVAPQLPMYSMGDVGYIANRSRDQIPERLDEGVPDRPVPDTPPMAMDGAPTPGELPYSAEGPPDGWYRLDEDLMDILDQVGETFRTDPDRVYLTGISYGGFGSWYIASRFPEQFAAVAPVVGYGHPDGVAPIAEHELPVWCFSGGRDPVVEPEYFYPAMNKLEELGHPEALLTNHEHGGHDIWVQIYAGRDIYDWLLSKRRQDITVQVIKP